MGPSKRAVLLFAGILVILVVLVAWVLVPAPRRIVQPIAYNHNIHIEGEGLECADCHAYAEELPSASLPSLEVCTECHDEEGLSESPEETILIEYITSEQEIPWQIVYDVPDHVYFSHRRHVSIGEMECIACHGNMAEMEEPPARPLQPVTMDWCMDCHKESSVTNDCLTCHR
jgi:hypothetical protein